jgi:hypothetical protein
MLLVLDLERTACPDASCGEQTETDGEHPTERKSAPGGSLQCGAGLHVDAAVGSGRGHNGFHSGATDTRDDSPADTLDNSTCDARDNSTTNSGVVVADNDSDVAVTIDLDVDVDRGASCAGNECRIEQVLDRAEIDSDCVGVDPDLVGCRNSQLETDVRSDDRFEVGCCSQCSPGFVDSIGSCCQCSHSGIEVGSCVIDEELPFCRYDDGCGEVRTEDVQVDTGLDLHLCRESRVDLFLQDIEIA